MDMSSFVDGHGKSKCDAMFALLEAGGKEEDGPVVSQQGDDLFAN